MNHITKKIAAAIVIAFITVGALPLFASAAPGIDRATLLSQHNAQRAANGNCSALSESLLLTQSAQAKAQDMANSSYFAHVYNGKTPADWVNGSGYVWSRMAENIYYDNSGGGNATNAWMNSPGHRANILGQFTQVGFGIVEVTGAYNGNPAEHAPYVIVVAHFGTPRGVTAPACPGTPSAPAPAPGSGSTGSNSTPPPAASGSKNPAGATPRANSSPTNTPSSDAQASATPKPAAITIDKTTTSNTPVAAAQLKDNKNHTDPADVALIAFVVAVDVWLVVVAIIALAGSSLVKSLVAKIRDSPYQRARHA